jgi:hypothetical protein
MVTVAANSPLFNLCRALLAARGSFLPVPPGAAAGFELVRVDAVANSDAHITAYETRQEVLKRLRQGGGQRFNAATEAFSAAKLHVLFMLMSLFQERRPDADAKSPRAVLPRAEDGGPCRRVSEWHRPTARD